MDSDEESRRSYYGVLGVDRGSSASEIRRAYRKLAMQWHPDRWTRNASFLGEAKQKFQKIQEAYSVLSDTRKRTMYDAGFYYANQEDEYEYEVGGNDEEFSDFMQELLSLMGSVKRKENKVYSMEELQQMFVEMARGFDSSYFPCFDGCRTERSSSSSYCSRNGSMFEDCCGNDSKRPRWESNPCMVGEF